jgi:hypothetical protein
MNFNHPPASASLLRERDHEEAIWRNYRAPDPEDYGYGGTDVQAPPATERTSAYWMAAPEAVPFKTRIGENSGFSDFVQPMASDEGLCRNCFSYVRSTRLNAHGHCNDCEPA